jgi:hypothetical protein
MTTVTYVTKSMVNKIENLKDNDTVCHICEVVKISLLLALPFALPVFTIITSARGY